MRLDVRRAQKDSSETSSSAPTPAAVVRDVPPAPHSTQWPKATGATQLLAYFGALAQERWNVEVLLLEVGDHRVSQRVHGSAFCAGGSHLTRRCLLHHNGWTHWLRAIFGLSLLGK